MAKEKLLVVTERFYPEDFIVNDLCPSGKRAWGFWRDEVA